MDGWRRAGLCSLFQTFLASAKKRISNTSMQSDPPAKRLAGTVPSVEPPTREREPDTSPPKVDLKALLALRTDYISSTGVASSLIRTIKGTKTTKPDLAWDWANNVFQLTPLREALNECQIALGADSFASNLIASDVKNIKKMSTELDIEVTIFRCRIKGQDK